MAYTRANTSNPLGVRPWGSRLSGLSGPGYEPAKFYVPTTSFSQPINAPLLPSNLSGCSKCAKKSSCMGSLGASFPNFAGGRVSSVVPPRALPSGPVPRFYRPPEFRGMGDYSTTPTANTSVQIPIGGQVLTIGTQPQSSVSNITAQIQNWLNGTTFGVSNGILAGGAALLFLLKRK